MGLNLVRYLKVSFVWSIIVPSTLGMVHYDASMVILTNDCWFSLDLERVLPGGFHHNNGGLLRWFPYFLNGIVEVVLPIPKRVWSRWCNVTYSALSVGLLYDSTWRLTLWGTPKCWNVEPMKLCVEDIDDVPSRPKMPQSWHWQCLIGITFPDPAWWWSSLWWQGRACTPLLRPNARVRECHITPLSLWRVTLGTMSMISWYKGTLEACPWSRSYILEYGTFISLHDTYFWHLELIWRMVSCLRRFFSHTCGHFWHLCYVF